MMILHEAEYICECDFWDEPMFYPTQELVRCKDCKYYFKSDEKCQLIDTRLHFYETDKRWAEDSFCSWAERRNDEID